MENQKRLIAINDLSGMGKCSLTVALPVISAAGIETICMPTSVLSTHTGGFTGYTFRDLTEDMPRIAAHWKSVGVKPDAIYSGFLGSYDQIEIVKQFAKDFRGRNTVFIADPCMADLGRLYSLFDEKFAAEMTSLCAEADIILPNITEACFMTGTEYVEGVQTQEYVMSLMEKLLDSGARSVILTGVSFEESRLGASCMGADRVPQYYFSDRLPGNYHGTGDVFASAFCGALLNGFTLYDSMRVAVEYVCDCIRRTRAMDDPVVYGVDFERGIPFYLRELGKV